MTPTLRRVSSLNSGATTHELPYVPLGKTIPRILHQTYATSDLPPEILENTARLKAANPGWEYRFYNDDDIVAFIANHYSLEVLRAYNRLQPEYGPARADLFRYLLMYRCGGVYLDIKSAFTRPIDEILKPDDLYVLSHWYRQKGPQEWHPELSHLPGGDEFQQWHIIAAPGHPFLRAVINAVLTNIDTYSPEQHGTGKPAVLRVTGPIAYTLAIYPLLPLHSYRLVPTETHLGLRYSVLKNKHSHETLFGNHYSTLKTPVVQREPCTDMPPSYIFSKTAPPSHIGAPKL